jgi:nitric oxide reductase activation protein
MADGIEFALNELSARPEAHRVLFVMTDGEPDPTHRAVINAQLRRAAQAGILVLGIGLGARSSYVKRLFPDHVFAPNLAALPKMLVAKLEKLVRTRHSAAKRGAKVRKS